MASIEADQGKTTQTLSVPFTSCPFLLLLAKNSALKISPIASWLKALRRQQQMNKDSDMPERGSVSNNNSCKKRASSTAKHMYNSLCAVLHTTIALHMSHHRLLHHQPDNRWKQKETYHGSILIATREEGSTICLPLLAQQWKLQFKTPLFCQIALALCSHPAWGNMASLYTGVHLGLY